MSPVQIVVYPRIHLSLIGMNNGIRRHGGIGFSISNPRLYISGNKSIEFHVIDERDTRLSDNECKRLLSTLQEYYIAKGFKHKIKIVIQGDVQSHYGFGSETAIRLACLEILACINRTKVSSNELVIFSRRGGVSGIGINTYFNGGFVFDMGISKNDTVFAPSNAKENRKNIPLTINKIKTPKWPLGLFVPTNIQPISESKEKLFFKRECPLKDEEVNKILYLSVYGCLASILENDKETFYSSINGIQNSRWKYKERKLYNGLISKYEKILFKAGACACGMSSLGPLIFYYSDMPIGMVIERAKKQGLIGKFYECTMINRGRKLINE